LGRDNCQVSNQEKGMSVFFHVQYIESDDVLFFTGKLPISANHGHFFGLASGKIKVCGDILVTRRIKELSRLLGQ
jgi:hypothetical protein